MTERRLVVLDPAGLHARRAADLVRVAGRYQTRTMIRSGGREADAGSLIEILLLAVRPGTEITLVAEGSDAEAALDALIAELGGSVAPADAAVSAPPDLATPG